MYILRRVTKFLGGQYIGQTCPQKVKCEKYKYKSVSAAVNFTAYYLRFTI